MVTATSRSGFNEEREEPCRQCKGSGKASGATTCSQCQGKRLVNDVVDLVVPIEKGLPEGHTVILRNFGDEKEIGAPSDLKLVFKEKNDGKWARSKLDIEHTMDITLQEVIP